MSEFLPREKKCLFQLLILLIDFTLCGTIAHNINIMNGPLFSGISITGHWWRDFQNRKMSFSTFLPEAPDTRCPSTSFPQTSVLTQPKAQAGENPPATVTMMESCRQRAPQSSTVCPLQDRRLWPPRHRSPAWSVYFFIGKGVFFRICRYMRACVCYVLKFKLVSK